MTIEKAPIMTPENPIPRVRKKYWLSVLGFAISAYVTGGFFDLVPPLVSIVLIIFSPFFYMFVKSIMINRIAIIVDNEAVEKLRNFVGKNLKYIDANASVSIKPKLLLSGSGIAYDGEYIYIMELGTVAKLTWNDIRKWKWSLPGYTTHSADSYSAAVSGSHTFAAASAGAVIGANIASNLQAQSANRQAIADASIASGFFITVADIERPVWQFMCDKQEILNKWFEIFNQINEGTLSIRKS